jgi:hypothetical protein
MRKRSQRILRNLLNEEVDRLRDEISGKTAMEIRLIFEREGIVDLIMALHDLRSTAVSRYLNSRQDGGQKVFRREQVLDDFGIRRMVWKLNLEWGTKPLEEGDMNGGD